MVKFQASFKLDTITFGKRPIKIVIVEKAIATVVIVNAQPTLSAFMNQITESSAKPPKIGMIPGLSPRLINILVSM